MQINVRLTGLYPAATVVADNGREFNFIFAATGHGWTGYCEHTTDFRPFTTELTESAIVAAFEAELRAEVPYCMTSAPVPPGFFD